eukprot:jgi/Botrbrau1/11521/Bobra.0393s0001.1
MSILQAFFWTKDAECRSDCDKNVMYLATFYGKQKNVLGSRGGRGLAVAPPVDGRLLQR